MSRFSSLRYRLPLLIALPLGVGVGALAMLAYSFAQEALLDATRSRILDVGKQLAGQFEVSIRRLDGDMRRLAADSAITRALTAADTSALAGARAVLARERSRSRELPTYVLLTRAGRAVVREGLPLSETADRLPTLSTAVGDSSSAAAIVITPIAQGDSGMTYQVIAPVLGSARDTLGYVVGHRRFAAAPASINLLSTLFGASSTLLMGNASGSLWTNLVVPVVGPASPIVANALAEYRDQKGVAMLAVAVPIHGTPWFVAIQVPRAVALAAAQGFRFSTVSLALAILLIGCLAAWWLSRHVTRPLDNLSRAAEAIAGGDYGGRATVLRHDELGKLASVFNVMAARVQDGRMSLERQNEALRESEERYRRLVDRAPDAILVHQDGRVLLANAAAARLFGAESQQELISREIATLLPDLVVPRPLTTMSGWTAASLHDEEGAEHLINFASLALQLDRAPAVLTFLRDVTEQQVLESRLRQAQKMEAIGQLAGGVAHDFNNLLTVITGYSGMLLMEMQPDASERAEIQEIADAAERAGVLTRQLLAFSRQQVLQQQVIDVNDVVRDMEKMLTRLIPENIRFNTKLEHSVGQVYADPGQIQQVLMNLVVNARDAMPDGGTINIESTRASLSAHAAELHGGAKPGDYVVLSVSDTGHGMSAEQQQHIFEPFYTTKKVGQGTGLGLATVYGIVKQSNGHIWVYSEVGHGSMFKVYLPLVDRPNTRRTQTPVSVHGARTGETVLLAEDGPQVRAAARQILERAGFLVLEAASAKDAVAILSNHPAPIHVLLTDMVMPDMSGRELALRFRALRPEAAVVFMSGYTQDSELLQTVLEAGVQFIQKPFTPQSLLGSLRAALDN